MRAKVALRANGHPLEERFLRLDPLQLTLIYATIEEEERKERKEKADLINLLNERWDKNLRGLMEGLQVFINPKMFKAYLDFEKTKELEKELPVEEFEELWGRLSETIPMYCNVVFEDDSERIFTPEQKAIQEEYATLISGWVNKGGSKTDGNG